MLYKCFASDFPRVTIGQHSSLRIEEGDTAVLTCKVKKMIPFVWSKNCPFLSVSGLLRRYSYANLFLGGLQADG